MPPHQQREEDNTSSRIKNNPFTMTDKLYMGSTRISVS